MNEPVVGCQVTSDSDVTQTGVWSLVGAASSLNFFMIDSTSGSIFATKDVDYEAETSYDLLVQYRIPSTSENGHFVPLVTGTRVTVPVEDVNDCNPAFQVDSKYVILL